MCDLRIQTFHGHIAGSVEETDPVRWSDPKQHLPYTGIVIRPNSSCRDAIMSWLKTMTFSTTWVSTVFPACYRAIVEALQVAKLAHENSVDQAARTIRGTKSDTGRRKS